LTKNHWVKLDGQSPPADDTKIRFVGVWDTVDAYGLPIDELATAWDYFIYPYRFTDRTLSRIVEQAAHALALDDERHTFHPILWDESKEGEAERIRQVWFAGAHANVGGGYPDDSLAHVSLDWMLSEIEDDAGKSPLIFLPRAREALAGKADVHGKLYNSRSGLQTYYRFKPRNILESCNDPANGVWAKVRVHESVFTRISMGAVHYSPFALPEEYEVVPKRRNESPAAFEPAKGKKHRIVAMEDVWDLVHWRRWLYVTLLVATLVLVVSPAILPWTESGSCRGWLCAVDSGLRLASPLLPDWSMPWQMALGQNPVVLFILAVIFLGQAVLSRWLRRQVARRATAAWRLSLAAEGAATMPVAADKSHSAIGRKLTRWLRTLCTGRCAAVRNAATATVALVLMLGAGSVLANKVLYGVGAALGFACTPSGKAAPLRAGGEPVTVTLDVSEPCQATGIALVGGERYTITVEARPASGVTSSSSPVPYPWRDGAIAAGAGGFAPDAVRKLTPFGQMAMRLLVTVRRVWSEEWFVLMGQTGHNSLQPFAIGEGLRWFKAPSSDELFVYVNDGVFGVPYLWALPYSWSVGENRGTARITVAPARAGRAVP
jgi:hypothetical protein